MLRSGLIYGLIYLALFAAVVGVRYLLDQQGPRSFGFRLDQRGRRLFAEGLLSGAAFFALYPLLVVLAGRGTITLIRDALVYSILFIAIWSFAYLALAIFEEALFRGYLLPRIMDRLPLPAAIGLPSLLFGIIHLLSHETPPTFLVGVLNASLFGVVMSIAVIQTGSLMWAIGCSLGWNVLQITLLANEYSHVHTALNLQIVEGRLAGTAIVPEAGWIMTAITLALGALTIVRFGVPRAAGKAPRSATQPDRP